MGVPNVRPAARFCSVGGSKAPAPAGAVNGYDPPGACVTIEPSITILHLSDMQVGRHHRFGRLGLGGADERFDTLLQRVHDDLAELEESLSVLSDQQALPDIREADAAFAAGDVIRGVDAVRALRP